MTTAPRSRGVAPPAEAWDRAIAGIEAFRSPDAWERIEASSWEKADGHIKPLLDKWDVDWLTQYTEAKLRKRPKVRLW